MGARPVERIKKIFQENGIPFLSSYDKAFVLAKYGWYIPGGINVTDLDQIIQKLYSDKVNEAETLLITYFKKNLKEIETQIKNKYVQRSDLFNEAFTCQKKKLYHASITLFLSQADGICEGKIFRGSKVLKDNLKESENNPVIYILGEKSPLNKDTREKTPINFFSDLNRHAVMHGLDFDFGNETNSLKAISLLCFVSSFYNRYKQK